MRRGKNQYCLGVISKLCRFTGLDWHRQTIPAFFEMEQAVYLWFYYFGIAYGWGLAIQSRKPA